MIGIHIVGALERLYIDCSCSTVNVGCVRYKLVLCYKVVLMFPLILNINIRLKDQIFFLLAVWEEFQLPLLQANLLL